MQMKFNENLLKLENKDSFYKATALVKEYKEKHPNHAVISLSIGDVSFPIPKHVANKMKQAVDIETSSNMVGYGNYYGISELRKAIRDNEYKDFSIDEIYVGQGSKSDAGDILELFDKDAIIGIPSPTYPIYLNSCLSLSKKVEIIPCDSSFIPLVPKKHFDVIYICSPNNPTGIAYTYNELKPLIDYANKEGCTLIFDNVYYRFIESGVKSIYEIEGSKTCAIELRSFSKHVSFTGIRCSYYVIPNQLHKDINKYWRLRTINRFNGASYIAQVGALASFDKEAQDEITSNILSYKENAKIIRKAFIDLGYEVNGGIDAPYLWIKCKNGLKSWEQFELYLNKIEVVIVPGAIFGKEGDSYFRVSSLGKREDIELALERIRKYEQKD